MPRPHFTEPFQPMIQASFRTLLMLPVGATPLTDSGLLAAGEAAIAPAAITVGAQKKERAAFTARQKLWSQNRFAMNRHACSPAGAGQGSRRTRACVRLHTEVVSSTIRARNSALRQSVATVPTFLA